MIAEPQSRSGSAHISFALEKQNEMFDVKPEKV